MNGTVPTLVVPMLETTGPESDSRYRSLRDTIVSQHWTHSRGGYEYALTRRRSVISSIPLEDPILKTLLPRDPLLPSHLPPLKVGETAFFPCHLILDHADK